MYHFNSRNLSAKTLHGWNRPINCWKTERQIFKKPSIKMSPTNGEFSKYIYILGFFIPYHHCRGHMWPTRCWGIVYTWCQSGFTDVLSLVVFTFDSSRWIRQLLTVGICGPQKAVGVKVIILFPWGLHSYILYLLLFRRFHCYLYLGTYTVDLTLYIKGKPIDQSYLNRKRVFGRASSFHRRIVSIDHIKKCWLYRRVGQCSEFEITVCGSCKMSTKN